MSADAKLPRALSLAVHEFRTPLSVVGGYLRMVLKDPTDTLNDRYRSMLGEAEKSCARIVALVAEMSDLSALESGKATLKRALFDLRPVLGEAIAQLPGVPERTVEVELTTGQGPAMIEGDSPRLKTALAALLHGLRRELVSTRPPRGPRTHRRFSWKASIMDRGGRRGSYRRARERKRCGADAIRPLAGGRRLQYRDCVPDHRGSWWRRVVTGGQSKGGRSQEIYSGRYAPAEMTIRVAWRRRRRGGCRTESRTVWGFLRSPRPTRC